MDQEAEKKRLNSLLISIALIMGLSLYVGLHFGYAMVMTANPDGSSNPEAMFELFQECIFNPLQCFPTNGTGVMLALLTGTIICLLKYQEYVKLKNTLKGREHGSAKFNSDYKGMLRGYVMSPKFLSKHFNKKYETVSAPGGRKLCKKTKFTKEEIAYCKLQSQIYSKNVALSQDTSLTQLNLNAVIFGGSGAGKSRFFVMPNLLQANSSYVVTDPSGELMAGTGKFLESQGYTIKCLNLEHMDESCRYNPFAYIYEDSDIPVMVNAIVNSIEGPKKGGGDNKFWDQTSTTLLAALCGYLFETCVDDNEFLYEYECDAQGVPYLDQNGDKIVKKNEDGTPKIATRPMIDSLGRAVLDSETHKPVTENIPNPHWKGCRNFTNVIRMLRMADVSDDREVDKDPLDLLFEDLEIANPNSYAVKQYKVIKSAGTGKTAQNIIISTMAIFARFFDLDKIANLTYKDEIHLEEIGQKKSALFIVTPQGDTTYNFLASLLYTQLFATLYHQGEVNAKERGTTSVRLDVPVRCLIDEAANIGEIPQFPQKIATMRKYGISVAPIYQNLSQIKSSYKDDWEAIIGNCDTMLFLGGIDSSTVKVISERLGKATINTDSNSENLGKQGGGSKSYQHIGRELMTTTEIEQMKNDHCIVFIRSMASWYDYKYPLEKHPNYKYSGMCDEKNSYAAPWHLVLDKQFLARIAVRTADDPDYLPPDRKKGVSEAEVAAVRRRLGKAPATSTPQQAQQSQPAVSQPAARPQANEAISADNGIVSQQALSEFVTQNPGVSMKLGHPTDPNILMETYEDPTNFEEAVLKNLRNNPIGRMLASMDDEGTPLPFVPGKTGVPASEPVVPADESVVSENIAGSIVPDGLPFDEDSTENLSFEPEESKSATSDVDDDALPFGSDEDDE